VTEKAQRTIHIKWVRSGIGFTYHQKGMVRSLGLRRLNQVVERPDTAQVRGLVASIPHLVEIVGETAKLAPWAAIPEYTLQPPEVIQPEPPTPEPAEVTASAQQDEPAGAEATAAKPAEAGKAKTHAPAKAKKAAKPAKAVEAKSKPGKEAAKKKAKAVAAKSAKPAKTKKK
jgi:large subunit ribosomal protein L30